MRDDNKTINSTNYLGIGCYDLGGRDTLFLNKLEGLSSEFQEGEFEFQPYCKYALSTDQKKLCFEQLATKISTKFSNLATKYLNEAISAALKEVSQFMGSDLSALMELDHRTGLIQHTQQWVAPGVTFNINFPDIDIYKSAPWVAHQLTKLEPMVISCLDDFPKAAAKERALAERTGIKSVVWVPIAIGGNFVACLVLSSLRRRMTWSNAHIQRLQLVGEIFGNALLRKQSEQALKAAFVRIDELKDRLESENKYLRDTHETRCSHEGIIGESKAVRQMLVQAEQVAATDSTVLLLGETGTGKELLAREIHRLSSRSGRPMIIVNCGALPATLIEAELFGREKGAYTGALSRQTGRFELADKSTLFLDEIGELTPELQIRLLRVLQDGTFERLGSTRTIKVDVRIIAATNRDLIAQVRDGHFREDLFYRLNVFPISIPPLRDRREDIPMLVWSFVREFSNNMGKSIEHIPVEAMERLQRYTWPGNVRELRNVIERALILARGKTLHVNLSSDDNLQSPEQSLEAVERAHIERILAQTNWQIAGKSGAAKILGMKPTTLRSRMERLGVPTRIQKG